MRSVLPLPRTPKVSATQRFLLLSICIGVISGLLVVCFHFTIDLLTWTTLGTPVGRSWMATILAPLLGGGLSALLLRHGFPEARGSGLTHTKAALYISDGYVPFRTVIAKFITCSGSIGTGNPLGPEDPALQMGAGVASFLGRTFSLPRDHIRLVAPIGAAAGMAAAFNTPITAVLFVMEEVIGSWNASVLGSIVLSAVSAVVVSRSFLGDQPLFRVPAFSLTHPSELVVYAAVGLAGGIAGAMFVRLLGRTRAAVESARQPIQAVLPFVVGGLVGTVGLWMPQVLGAGYGSVDAALRNQFSWPLLLGLALAKLALTALCFASGTPGGMFAPTLFAGAMTGGALGTLAQLYWPAPTSAPSAYVLVGMGAFFAAVFRAPMTSIFMVFEVSASYAILLPVMVANLVAYLVSRGLQQVAFVEMIAAQDGLDLPSQERQRESRPMRVEDAMTPAEGVVPRGVTLYPDQSLDSALRAFRGDRVLPVVSRKNVTEVLGVLNLEAVLRTYGIRDTEEPSTHSDRSLDLGSAVDRQ